LAFHGLMKCLPLTFTVGEAMVVSQVREPVLWKWSARPVKHLPGNTWKRGGCMPLELGGVREEGARRGKEWHILRGEIRWKGSNSIAG
jgi:hypothetical protein